MYKNSKLLINMILYSQVIHCYRDLLILNIWTKTGGGAYNATDFAWKANNATSYSFLTWSTYINNYSLTPSLVSSYFTISNNIFTTYTNGFFDLSYDNISGSFTIPKALYCTKLKFDHNLLTNLDTSFTCDNVTELDISYNEFATRPSILTAAKLGALKKLYMHHINFSESVTEILSIFPNLEKLSISNKNVT